jgi:vacuolar protein sorting-associated protein 35
VLDVHFSGSHIFCFHYFHSCRQICLFIQNIISGLKIQSSEQCFNLSIQAAAAADCCTSVAKARGANIENLSPVAYTFFTEAFLAYEGGISDPKSQVPSISAMVGTLLACKSVDANDYETLITKVTQYAARLAKKSDQCKMVMLCSHLFYYYEENGYRNPQRVLECLQRSLKVADMCMASTPANLQLFVDVLDTYLYHFEKQNPIIVDKYISGLIALVNEHVNSIGANPVIAETKSHFIQIVKSIEEKKNDSVTSIHFGNIVCAMPS